MKSIAIIGTGIAGMACGYFLHHDYDLTIYEKNDYIGGHTNTVILEEDRQPIYIDTGFMVYNEVTYPNLTRLFQELEVETKPTTMSFSVQHVPSGLEFCGSGLDGLFAQRKNLFRPSFYRFLKDVNRFNSESSEVLTDERFKSYTLERYVREKEYGDDLLHHYLIPMSSAVWSTPPDQMLKFPAVTLVRFFKNHGFLGLNTQHPWRTVVRGSQAYREKITKPFKDRVRLSQGAAKVQRLNGRVLVTDVKGESKFYDQAILACHADQALRLLADPTEMERSLLTPFYYQKNKATLHTDASVMPQTKKAWSSWNYRMDRDAQGELHPSTIYYMNSLQQVSHESDYFVSINDPDQISPGLVIRQIQYEHPLFSLEAIDAQKGLHRLNENDATFFCGSYFRYGFHEDALAAALQVVQPLLGREVWS